MEMDLATWEPTGAYLAGLFDAEGYLGIRGVALRLSIGISNTYKPLLLRLKSLFGGTVFLDKHTGEALGSAKNCYKWEASPRFAINFLKLVEPFTVVKGEKVSLALESLSKFGTFRAVKSFSESDFKERFNYKVLIEKESRPKEPYKNRPVPHPYFSGFFDGEGYVGFQGSTTVHAVIANNCLEPLGLIQEAFGGHFGLVGSKCHSLSLCGKDAISFYKEVYPFSIIKKDQIELVLSLASEIPPVGKGGEYTEEEQRRILACDLLLKALKKVSY